MMDQTERAIFAAGVQRAVSESSGGALDTALEAMGFSDALEVDERTAVATVFEAQGSFGATSSALGGVLLSRLGLGRADGAALVLPQAGSAELPARVVAADDQSAFTELKGLGLCDLRDTPRAVVLCERSDTLWSTVVDMDSIGTRAIDGLDPAMELSEVATPCLPSDAAWEAVPGSWKQAVASGRLAIAHELVGAMRTMLALARDHAVDRIQFGRPISGFQAVRHRLAESLVAIEAAEAALEGAWSDVTPFSAQVAKAVAGDSARTVRRHCQQVLAGIGFTTEHDLHLYVRRTMVLDALLGDARSLTEEVGRQLLEDGHLPDVLPL